MKFYILDTKNNLWSEKLNSFSKKKKDIFYQQKFADLCQKTIYKNYSINCLIAENEDDIIICPIIKRKFNFQGKNFFDLTSLYNLGGPIQKNNNIILQNFFAKKFAEYCVENKIINYFIRFHPIIKNLDIFLNNCELINTGEFISVNLDTLKYPIVKNFHHRHQKSIKKAINYKIEIIVSNEKKYIEDFIRIYYKEMKFKNAEDFYFFEKDFFFNLEKHINNNYQFFYAKYKNKIISCELVLFSDHYCHSFLGSTKEEFKYLCSNHLLKQKIIEHFKDKKLKFYLIGGGPNPNDGIFKYKKGFSNEKPRKNFIGKIYYNKKFYNSLINKFKENYSNENFKKLQFYEKYL